MESLIEQLLDEKKIYQILTSLRCPNGIKCLFCNSKDIETDSLYRGYDEYHCKSCDKYFNIKTGTIFAYTNVPLKKWIMAIYLLSLNKSNLQIAEELDVNPNTADRIINLIRDSILAKQLKEKLTDTVEIDEVYVGSKPKNREPRKRGLKIKGRGNWDRDKPPVVGAVQRNGEVRFEVCKRAEKEELLDFIISNVKEGTTVYTDELKSYDGLEELGYKHETINHSEREYARGNVHTNTQEGIWSLLRQWLRTHRGVCKRYLYKYVKTFEFFYNLSVRGMEKMLYILLILLNGNLSIDRF
jgi:transposase-like protein